MYLDIWKIALFSVRLLMLCSSSGTVLCTIRSTRDCSSKIAQKKVHRKHRAFNVSYLIENIKKH